MNFLNLITNELYQILNFNEFHLLNENLNNQLKNLEDELNCYIMSYKLHPKTDPNKMDLCKLLFSANLSEEQFQKLQECEARMNNVILVAYAKPLQYR